MRPNRLAFFENADGDHCSLHQSFIHLGDAQSDRLILEEGRIHWLPGAPTAASDFEHVVNFEPNLGQTGKISVTIKELIVIVLLHFDELDDLVSDRIGKDTYRVPCGQSKFRVIPIARKARITPKSVFNRLRVHMSCQMQP